MESTVITFFCELTINLFALRYKAFQFAIAQSDSYRVLQFGG